MCWIVCWKQGKIYFSIPAEKYMFKVNNRNIRTRFEICSKLTIKTPERCCWHCSGVFIINFEHISHLFLVFLLLTLSRHMLVGSFIWFMSAVLISTKCRCFHSISEYTRIPLVDDLSLFFQHGNTMQLKLKKYALGMFHKNYLICTSLK